MDKKEWAELDELIKKDKAGTLTKREKERFDILYKIFIKEKLYMGGRDD